MLTPQEKVDLEALVDRHRLDDVLDALAEVCREKATHLRSNWQDDGSAHLWDEAAEHVEEASSLVFV